MSDHKWFTDARFGMFIHFGLYSVAAKGEWIASIEKISSEKYRNYFETFSLPQNIMKASVSLIPHIQIINLSTPPSGGIWCVNM